MKKVTFPFEPVFLIVKEGFCGLTFSWTCSWKTENPKSPCLRKCMFPVLGVFFETKMKRNEISCRMLQSAARDQCFLTVSWTSGIFDNFWIANTSIFFMKIEVFYTAAIRRHRDRTAAVPPRERQLDASGSRTQQEPVAHALGKNHLHPRSHQDSLVYWPVALPSKKEKFQWPQWHMTHPRLCQGGRSVVAFMLGPCLCMHVLYLQMLPCIWEPVYNKLRRRFNPRCGILSMAD